MKKSLVGKTLIKNFSMCKSGVGHYHFDLKSQVRNDCSNIFAPVAKMIFANYYQLEQSADRKVFDFLKRRGARPVLILPGETRPAKEAKRSGKTGQLFPGKTVPGARIVFIPR